jgi:DNA-binding Lrp family transcriptional regulator
MKVLDEIDRSILALLQEDDRRGLAEIGKSVGLAASSVNDRIKRLTRARCDRGIPCEASRDALGPDLLAFVFVGWSESGDRGALPRAYGGRAGGAPMPSRHRRLELSAQAAPRRYARPGALPQRRRESGAWRAAHRIRSEASVSAAAVSLRAGTSLAYREDHDTPSSVQFFAPI